MRTLRTRRRFVSSIWIAPLLLGAITDNAGAQAKKPNIIMIMGDDVGIWNISAYHRGMMGGRTPNIDKIAAGGALFTDYYAQQSCTAGRAAFILGQTPFRTGLLKVGLPAAKQGIQDKDPTIAEMLKPLGYATAQIGKNHLGDRNEYLPTVHGFDEFYGILYHLNAMEEPYEGDYPKAAGFKERFGPRNIVDTKATKVDDPTTDERWGKVGKQTIADGGASSAPEHGPESQGQYGGRGTRTRAAFYGFHGSLREGGHSVLPVAQRHPNSRLDTPFAEMGEQERLWTLRRRHDGAGLGGRRDSEKD
jgi:Sulfatase